jgi:hypothetical protein
MEEKRRMYKINANGGGICKGYNFFSGGGGEWFLI